MRTGRMIMVAAAALTLATGCSNSPSASPTSSPEAHAGVTQEELCNSLMAFFSGELQAVDLGSVAFLGKDTIISPSGSCTITNSQTQRSNGRFEIHQAPNDPTPIENRKKFFVETTEMGKTVWVWDWRTDLGNPTPQVVFATRIGEWNSELQIEENTTQTASGVLHLTDENKHKAAQFLLELTKRIVDAQ
ncbi:hypothetical protein ACQP1G_43850 [Nocardia sp. CA-107356]|uniref:hypothetical protein n=1 Tax=Nocardia sp. CA-107356 TaxID=3239972 RepID=UPI003D9140CC